jgi:hypothetical protein
MSQPTHHEVIYTSCLNPTQDCPARSQHAENAWKSCACRKQEGHHITNAPDMPCRSSLQALAGNLKHVLAEALRVQDALQLRTHHRLQPWQAAAEAMPNERQTRYHQLTICIPPAKFWRSPATAQPRSLLLVAVPHLTLSIVLLEGGEGTHNPGSNLHTWPQQANRSSLPRGYQSPSCASLQAVQSLQRPCNAATRC